ncbi:hypothetical protein [Streptomyces sp. NRRL S-813]|uniref:hypothetical protein n=1 Tax=Streptomyces sp. NRRL S-813 TaxID=1463919 RepID=UPI000A43A434|nr:hypothetical protein [Streptomyces sp. NRRL S-813]
MAADVTEARSDGRPHAEQRRRGALVRGLLFVLTALVAGAGGVGGTLAYQRVTAEDTAAVDAQADRLAEDLRADLNVGFYSPGQTYGGQFTEGTLVAQTEAHGGVLLSSGTTPGGPGGRTHTMTVMLGLVPPETGTVDAHAYPVRCYRYTFAVGTYSVKKAAVDCPAVRSDGRPGSLVAQMGALLAQQSTGASRRMATAGYPHTARGAVDFLRDKRLVAAQDTVSEVSGGPAGGGVDVFALRVDGTCHYLRMDSSSTASRLVPLWLAPADEQGTCDMSQARAASALYGIDPAKAG